MASGFALSFFYISHRGHGAKQGKLLHQILPAPDIDVLLRGFEALLDAAAGVQGPSGAR